MSATDAEKAAAIARAREYVPGWSPPGDEQCDNCGSYVGVGNLTRLPDDLPLALGFAEPMSVCPRCRRSILSKVENSL